MSINGRTQIEEVPLLWAAFTQDPKGCRSRQRDGVASMHAPNTSVPSDGQYRGDAETSREGHSVPVCSRPQPASQPKGRLRCRRHHPTVREGVDLSVLRRRPLTDRRNNLAYSETRPFCLGARVGFDDMTKPLRDAHPPGTPGETFRVGELPWLGPPLSLGHPEYDICPLKHPPRSLKESPRNFPQGQPSAHV